MARKARATKKVQKVFPFEQFPTELRELVYDEFLAPGTIKITRGRKIGVPKTTKSALITTRNGYPRRGRLLPKNGLAIFCVSKGISAEALPVLYGKNKFDFSGMPALQQFVREVNGNAALLREVIIPAASYSVLAPAINNLHIIKNLRSMEIRLDPHHTGMIEVADIYDVLLHFVTRKDTGTDRKTEAGKISFAGKQDHRPERWFGHAWSFNEVPVKMKEKLMLRLEDHEAVVSGQKPEMAKKKQVRRLPGRS